MNAIEIKTIASNEIASLVTFYKTVYGSRLKYKYPERWEWLYGKNKLKESQDYNLIVAKEGERIIGQTGQLIVNSVLFGNVVPLTWSTDTIVLKNRRGRGVGKALQEYSQNTSKIFASLAMSDSNRAIKLKIGGVEICEIYSLYVFGNPIKNFILNAAWPQLSLNRKAYDRNEYKIKIADFSLEDDIVKFIEQNLSQYDLFVMRDRGYLIWRYGNTPFVTYKHAKFYLNNKLELYAIYRVDESKAKKLLVISEIFFSTNDQKIIFAFIKYLIDYHNVAQVCMATTERKKLKIFMSMGFFVQDKSKIIAHLREAHTIKPLQKVYFSLGDHDLDQFPNIKYQNLIKLMARKMKLLSR